MTGNRKEHISFLPVAIIVLSSASAIAISTTLVFTMVVFSVLFTRGFAEAVASHSGLYFRVVSCVYGCVKYVDFSELVMILS